MIAGARETIRERAKRDLCAWFEAMITEEAAKLAREQNMDLLLAECCVRMVFGDLARASFEKSRRGIRT